MTAHVDPYRAFLEAKVRMAPAMPDVKRRRRAKVPTWPGFPIQPPRQSCFLEAAE
jgi:hypothetical protein